jgi:hypothetical protein
MLEFDGFNFPGVCLQCTSDNAFIGDTSGGRVDKLGQAWDTLMMKPRQMDGLTELFPVPVGPTTLAGSIRGRNKNWNTTARLRNDQRIS